MQAVPVTTKHVISIPIRRAQTLVVLNSPSPPHVSYCFRIRGEHTYHYTIDAVNIRKGKLNHSSKYKSDT